MNAAAIAHYGANAGGYDPRAAQQLRDAAAQARQQPGPRLLPGGQAGTAALEGELLDKPGRQTAATLSEEDYQARHQAHRALAGEGHQSQAQRAIAAYQGNAQLTHPAYAERIGILDVYV